MSYDNFAHQVGGSTDALKSRILPVEIIEIAGDAMPRNAKLLAAYCDEDELAEEVNHSVRTLRGWRRDGKGPPFVRIGRRAFYRKDGVLEWLRSKEKEAVDAA